MIMKDKTQKKEKTFKNSLKGSRLWGLMLFVILVIVDQITKIIADVYFSMEGTYDKFILIPGMLEWEMSYNRGIAFGALSNGNPTLKLVIVIMTAVLMAVLAFVYFKMDKNRTLFRLALIFIIAGGIGNFIDRINYGVWDPAYANGGYRDGVRDMLRVILLIDFGYCNFADFFIVAGVIMMILSMLFFDTHALYPHGKYEKLALEATMQENKRKSEKFRKKYDQYRQGT